MAVWDDVLADEDRAVYEFFGSRFNPEQALGKRPAVIVVDVNYGFVGSTPAPILQSMEEFHTSCGERGWESIKHIQALLSSARDAGVPIIYSTGTSNPRGGAAWANRARSAQALELVSGGDYEHRKHGNTIVKEIEPQHGDVVLTKRAASVFSDTPLMGILNEMDIDTLLVTGTTTSGCVRATAVDAACAHFHVGIVEECTFDRFQISHKVSLMDMHAKYGMVTTLAETQRYLATEAEPTWQPRQPSKV